MHQELGGKSANVILPSAVATLLFTRANSGGTDDVRLYGALSDFVFDAAECFYR